MFRQTYLYQSSVANELQVFLHHGGIHAQYTTRHSISGIFYFQLGSLHNHLRDLFFHTVSPQVRIFQFDLIDHVDTEIEVHGLISQYVLELLGSAGHLVTPPHRQYLGKSTVKENSLQAAIECDQIAQQLLIGFNGAGLKGWIRNFLGVFESPGSFLRH